MPDYRRQRVPGGTYFFTVNLLERKSRLLVDQIEALRAAVRKVRAATVSHRLLGRVARSHTLRLDSTRGRCRYRSRWKAIKIEFSKSVPKTGRLSAVRFAKGNGAFGNGARSSAYGELGRWYADRR
jgi:putative transposase